MVLQLPPPTGRCGAPTAGGKAQAVSYFVRGRTAAGRRRKAVVFQFGICSYSCRTAEFNAVHIYPNEEVVHDTRAGKTQRLAGQAFEACPQREMLALDLLHRQLSYSV